MAMKIDPDECTACGDCAAACPNEAIISKSAWFVVNADKCDECEVEASPHCMASCPSRCIEYI